MTPKTDKKALIAVIVLILALILLAVVLFSILSQSTNNIDTNGFFNRISDFFGSFSEGASDTVFVSPTRPLDTSSSFTQGFWDNNIFILEDWELRFVLPFAWEQITDFNMTVHADIPEAVFRLEHYTTLADNFFAFTNIHVSYQSYGNTTPSALDIFNEMDAHFSSFGADFIELEPIEIAGERWYAAHSNFRLFHEMTPAYYFFRISSGYIHMISIAYTDSDTALLEPPAHILASFIGLDDPLPPAPVLAGYDAFLGAWHWDENSDFLYVFHADGTGTRGFISDGFQHFHWYVLEDSLFITPASTTPEWVEHWAFSIDNGALHVSSRQVPDLAWTYLHAPETSPNGQTVPTESDIEQNSSLVGMWDWDTDSSFTYVFNADGTGRRGFTGAIHSFYWHTDGSNLYIDTGIMVESWHFSIVDNVLTIDSNQVADMRWSYIRRIEQSRL